MSHELIFFVSFALFVILMLAVDLGVFHKKDTPVSFNQAAIMSAVWVSFALVFYFLLKTEGHELHDIQNQAQLEQIVRQNLHQVDISSLNFQENLIAYKNAVSLEFITGYVIEYALSVDNIFVMVLIFSAFGVDEKYYHRVLFWGIIGAVLMRFLFIFLGAALLQKFDWIIYVFGAFLVYTGVKILFSKHEEEEIDTANHPVVRLLSKFFNVYKRNVIGYFFVRMKNTGKIFITPIFIVVVVIAFTDILFAVDSIPAIFSISKDPYIVFFSNVFAVMGLRSLFFFLSSLMGLFRFLPMGLGVLLSFVGGKMLAHSKLEEWGFGTLSSLGVIIGILTISILLSVLFPAKKEA